MSGFETDEDKRRAMEAGFDEFLTKPAHLHAIRPAVMY
jgi:DNA-binding response OmpR family regulator